MRGRMTLHQVAHYAVDPGYVGVAPSRIADMAPPYGAAQRKLAASFVSPLPL